MVVIFFRLDCSVVLWGGPNKYHWPVLTVTQPPWVCPCSRRVCFPSLHCSDSRLLCRKLSDGGPGLHALPRSKPLRFRFSDTPQRRRLGWACVLHQSQVQPAQVTRRLVRIVTPSWRLRLIPSPSQPLGCVLGVQWCTFSGGPSVSSGELISGCDPPGRYQPSRIPRSLG